MYIYIPYIVSVQNMFDCHLLQCNVLAVTDFSGGFISLRIVVKLDCCGQLPFVTGRYVLHTL